MVLPEPLPAAAVVVVVVDNSVPASPIKELQELLEPPTAQMAKVGVAAKFRRQGQGAALADG